MAPSVVAVHDHAYIEKDGNKVVLINSPTNSVMPVVLAHRSSMNCIFVASGGLFLGYLELMDNDVTFLPLTHPHSSITRSFGDREYRVETRNCWVSPCMKRCPTLWRRMDDGLAITWHNGLVPSEITRGQNLHWRLTSHCANFAISNNIFSDPDPYSGAYVTHSVDRRINDINSRNAGLPCVTGLLFGAAMMRPYPVPLYLDKGRTSITDINDLNVHPFIREKGMEPDNIIDCSVTRQMIIMSDCAFTIIREHDHVLDTISSLHHVGPFYKTASGTFPSHHPVAICLP
ncbi:hypothetical protein EV702DRAFT_1203351 [Suillus placidus]|uniref:Uncharacterized protein n=1 Tax=Suillus placidus TaxID=48579 RepID=A0A9P6ZJU7_9AGAM|nr:hypothetical protein EV702DRAFT_1203351 [Suillus placidus]